MYNLPLYADIIIPQGGTFTLPVALDEEFYDDETGESWSIPWDTSGMAARFAIRPILAEGEYGDAVIDVTHESGIELGVMGPPGLTSSVFVWIPPATTAIEPFGLGAFELRLNTGTREIVVVHGTARLQRGVASPVPPVPA